MFRSPARLIALVASVLVLVIAATVVYLMLPQRKTADVAVPAPNATPEQVVTAYLAALNAHDCDTVRALTTEGGSENAKTWCEDVASLTDVDVANHLKGNPQQTGHSLPEEVANVQVSFNLNWRPLHNDGSMDEGNTAWGYLLVRTSATSPWRIFDQGMG